MKNYHSKYILYFISFFLLSPLFPARSQELNTYHLSTANGLPTDAVIDVIQDKYGYLWIATEKGVVKYNGYEYIVFDKRDGLSNDDIMGLFEDKKGRIWLTTISNDLGYIYNDKYYNSSIKINAITIEADRMKRHNDGIAFFNDYHYDDLGLGILPNLYIFNSDSFTILSPPKSISVKSPFKKEIGNIKFYILNDSNVCYIKNDTLYYANILKSNNIVVNQKIVLPYPFYRHDEHQPITGTLLMANKLVGIKLAPPYDTLSILNPLNGEVEYAYLKKVLRKGEESQSFYVENIEGKNVFSIRTDTRIIVAIYAKDFNAIEQHNIASLEKNNKYVVHFCRSNSFWGCYIGVLNDGIYINNELKNNFIKSPTQLYSIEFIGLIKDSIAIWHDTRRKKIMSFDKNNNRRLMSIKGMDMINLIYYKNGKVLTFLLNTFEKFPQLKRAYDSLKEKKPHIQKIVSAKNKTVYYISLKGLYVTNADTLGDGIQIDNKQYTDLVFDTVSNTLIAYNDDGIYIKNEFTTKFIDRAHLDKMGLGRIEAIQIDAKWENIFVKTTDKLYIIDLDKEKAKEVLPQKNLYNSRLYLYNNRIVIISKSGLTFSLVKGKDSISKPLTYGNIKNNYYSDFYDAQVAFNKVLLSTDRGSYTINIPTDSELINNENNYVAPRYKLLAFYKDTTILITSNDSLVLDQKNLVIRFDVINPNGFGKVRYTYSVAGQSGNLYNNEFALPRSLVPGVYYSFYIKASDDAWRGDEKKIVIYIKPSPWQKFLISKYFIPAVIFITILLIGAVVLITRRIVILSNVKKNFNQEVELKSVYSQINPHFIFNTLNTALYFIKKGKIDEAYQHVSKFSLLLRAYIKSSRSRYISIADEIVNLNNYIQLQQSRFEDKFDYEIIIEPGLPIDSINIPALLLQPVVENAIDHGLFHKKEKGFLKIEFKQGADGGIVCIVDDNGIGRQQSKLLSSHSLVKAESYGDSLIKDLVTIFNKYEKMGIKIEYFDKISPEIGTIVTISIHYPHTEK